MQFQGEGINLYKDCPLETYSTQKGSLVCTAVEWESQQLKELLGKLYDVLPTRENAPE